MMKSFGANLATAGLLTIGALSGCSSSSKESLPPPPSDRPAAMQAAYDELTAQVQAELDQGTLRTDAKAKLGTCALVLDTWPGADGRYEVEVVPSPVYVDKKIDSATIMRIGVFSLVGGVFMTNPSVLYGPEDIEKDLPSIAMDAGLRYADVNVVGQGPIEITDGPFTVQDTQLVAPAGHLVSAEATSFVTELVSPFRADEATQSLLEMTALCSAETAKQIMPSATTVPAYQA